MIHAIRSFISQAWSSLGGVTASLAYYFKRQLPGYEPPDFSRLAHALSTDPIGSRAMQLLVSTMSSVPLQVEQMRGEETKVLEEHPVLDLLKRPHPRMTYARFIRAYLTGLYAGGEVWLRGLGPDTGPNAGVPRRLRIHQTTQFAGFIGSRLSGGASPMDIEGYKLTVSEGLTSDFTLEEAHHIFNYDPNNEHRGLPLLLAGWRDLRKQEAADAWNIGLAEGGGRLSGVWTPVGLEPGEQVNPQDHKAAKKALRDEERKARASGDSLVLSGSYDYQKSSATPTDADLVDMQDMSGKRIAVAMGVDPSLVGDSGSRTLANLEQGLRALYLLTVLPLLDDLLDELNAWLLPKYGDDLRLTYDKDAIDVLQEDMSEKYERYTKAHGGPILTLQEAREALGYSTQPEGSMVSNQGETGEGGSNDDDDDDAPVSARSIQIEALDDILSGDPYVPGMRNGWAGDGA